MSLRPLEGPQGAVDGNPYEEHKTAFGVEDFTRLGFEVSVSGMLDEPKTKANILASWSDNG